MATTTPLWSTNPRHLILSVAIVAIVLTVMTGAGAAETSEMIVNGSEKIQTTDDTPLTNEEVSAASVDGGVALAGTSEYIGISPGETITIWTGAVDEDTPAADTDVTVAISDPSGEVVDTFERTTDDDGSVAIDYEIPEESTGVYTVNAETESDEYLDTTTFTVGTSLSISTSESFSGSTFVDREAKLSVRATDQDGPVSGETADVSIVNPDGETVDTAAVETDSDGFDQITFTPEMTGTYSVETDGDSSRLAGGNDDVVVTEEILEYGDSMGNDHYVNESVPITGHVYNSDGPATGESISFNVVDESDDVVTTLNGSVDAGGAFHVEWKDPAESGYYELEPAVGGEMLPSGKFDEGVTIEERSDDESEPEPELNVEFEDGFDSQFVPGDSVAFDVTAEDEDGDPISGETVEVLFGYGYGPDVPVETIEVETNETGQASGEFGLPENAPTGQGVFQGKATLELDDKTLSGSTSPADVQEYFVELNPVDDVVPGEETEFELSATTADGDPVSDVHYGFDFQYNHRQKSITTASATTGEDGTDSITIDVPNDVQQLWTGESGFYPLDGTRAWSYSYGFGQAYQSFDVDHPDAGLTVDAGEVEPGGTVTAEFDADVETAVVSTTGYNYAGDSKIVEPGDEVTFDVPAETDAYGFDVTVTGLNDDLSRVTASERVRITDDPDPSPTLETDFEYEPKSPTANDSVAFSASIIEADNSIETYSWDFDDDGTSEASGKNATHTFEEAGDQEVTLTVTDTDGTTDTTTRTVSVELDTDEDTKGERIEAPTGVEIPREFANSDGTVDPSGLADAATGFREGDIDPATLADVAGAFRAS